MEGSPQTSPHSLRPRIPSAEKQQRLPSYASLKTPLVLRKASFQRPTHMEEYGTNLDPASILHNPHFNKFTAFSFRERECLGLRGLLPHHVEDINTQAARCYAQYSRFSVPLSKHIYLATLRDRNDCLYYRLVIDHLEEMLPIIYTPTVGQVCMEFGHQMRQAEGMYFCREDSGHMFRMLDNWRPNAKSEVAIIVVTDGSRILGLGDLGACGMGISLGKLSLYVAAGGFHPATILPVVLDTGTNNEKLLQDDFYQGQKHRRLTDDAYYKIVDEFLTAVKKKWPTCLVQFEDFSNNHCFNILQKYRKQMLCFNDDIQGTGCVVAAGFLNALKIAGVNSGDAIKKQKFLMVGAGAAGTGVAEQICRVFGIRYGIEIEEARKLFYLMDTKGLLYSDRGDELQSFKLPYARTEAYEKPINDVLQLVEMLKPVALIGLSCTPGVFNEKVLQRMSEINKRPIVFALSNPTSKSECSFESAVINTKGSVIFAAGSPFADVTFEGKTYSASQGNNLYAFPGIGFGAHLCDSTQVSDGMIDAATLALADGATESELQNDCLYPALRDVRHLSAKLAVAVIQQSNREGLALAEELPYGDGEMLLKIIKNCMYEPIYLESYTEDSVSDQNTEDEEGDVAEQSS